LNGERGITLSHDGTTEAEIGLARLSLEDGQLRERVVLLYPTRNDLRKEAVAALRLVQAPGGGTCEVVLCDDSTLEEWRMKVDALALEATTSVSPCSGDNPQLDEQAALQGLNQMRVIRRPAESPGWKAGNINYALRRLKGEGFTHFAVCDADGILPKDFVERTVQYFRNGDGHNENPHGVCGRVAFAQTRQEGDRTASTSFSRSLAPAVGAHFRQQVAGRSAGEGFVMFYGHGALISMEAWHTVGGFPEIVTEDLAFSMELRAMGWRGVYADEVVCTEEFPLTWPQLRKRTDKWIRGTAECLKLHGRTFFGSREVPWTEKVDVFMHGSQHFLAVPMLLFLVLLATVLPWQMKEFRLPGSFFLPPVPQGKTLVEAAIELRYHVFWSWDFYLMMVVAMLSPLLAFSLESLNRRNIEGTGQDEDTWDKNSLRDTNRTTGMVAVDQVPGVIGFRWGQLPGFFLASTFTYLGGVVAESLSVLVYLGTGRATFRVTNDAAEASIEAAGNCPSSVLQGRQQQGFNPNDWLVYALEVVIGAGFLVATWLHRNLWFLGPGIALILSPLVASRRFGGFERWWIRTLTAVPGLCIMALLALIGWQLIRWR
jgi:cellulose synthase/poly-beta-1,6-N-acetylglucosamine synthase-like glycosyltransferase